MKHHRFILRFLCILCMLSLLLGGCSLEGILQPIATEPEWDNLPVTTAAADPEAPAQGIVTRYYYDLLSNREKHAYNMILAEIGDFPTRIEIPILTQAQLSKVFEALIYDCPTLLFLGLSCQVETMGTRAFFVCGYRYDKAGYEQRMAQLNEAVQDLLKRIPKNASDFEKELFVHDAIISACEYTNTGAPEESSAYGALVEKKASCEGYARAMKLMMDALGIPCYLVGGSASDDDGHRQNHMWNIVSIGGEYYHVDLTWDDPLSQDKRSDLRYVYFNLSDTQISRTHTDFQSVNPCTASAANYFVKKQLLFKSYDKAVRSRIAAALSVRVNEGHRNLEFQFASKATYQQAVDGLFNTKQHQLYEVLKAANSTAKYKIDTASASYIKNDSALIINLIVTVKK